MAADEPTLDYEPPLDRVGGTVGSLAYAVRGRVLTVTGPYDEPLGRGRWIGRAAMALGAIALALLVLAGVTGGGEARHDLGPVRITASPYAVWGLGLMLAAFLLRPAATFVARRRRQRIVIDADPDVGLTVRKESLLPGGEQEAHHWPREDLIAITHHDGMAVGIHTRSGNGRALDAGRTYQEREWLAATLSRHMMGSTKAAQAED